MKCRNIDARQRKFARKPLLPGTQPFTPHDYPADRCGTANVSAPTGNHLSFAFPKTNVAMCRMGVGGNGTCPLDIPVHKCFDLLDFVGSDAALHTKIESRTSKPDMTPQCPFHGVRPDLSNGEIKQMRCRMAQR